MITISYILKKSCLVKKPMFFKGPWTCRVKLFVPPSISPTKKLGHLPARFVSPGDGLLIGLSHEGCMGRMDAIYIHFYIHLYG